MQADSSVNLPEFNLRGKSNYFFIHPNKQLERVSDLIVSFWCTCRQQCRQNLLLDFRLNLLVDFSGFVMGSSSSLKVCYIKICYVRVFLEEQVLRNSLEKEIEISAWKEFASSHLWTDPWEGDKDDD